MSDVPHGFEPWQRSSPFLDGAIGQLYVRASDMTFGLRVGDRHTNSRGAAHGGLLMTVADLALGHCALASVDPKPSMSTLSMSVDFVAAVRPGDWVEAETEVIRVGRRTAFARVLMTARDRPVLRASAVFAVT